MTKIAIVGGGLAGISAARHAISNGVEFDLFEASDNFGGRLKSTVIDSFAIDKGFQVVNVNYPELRKLLPNHKVKSKALFVALNFIDRNGDRRDISPLNSLSLISPFRRLQRSHKTQQVNCLQYIFRARTAERPLKVLILLSLRQMENLVKFQEHSAVTRGNGSPQRPCITRQRNSRRRTANFFLARVL